MMDHIPTLRDEVVQLDDDQFYILSTSGRIDDRTRVLKHGDTFAVFDRFGEIDALNRSQFGVFHQDTRFLSRFTIRLNQARLLLLSSAIKEDNARLTVDLTNPDVEQGGEVTIPRGTLHLFRSLVLWNGTCYERLRIHNYGRAPAKFRLNVRFDADFADIFEVRGLDRHRRGRTHPVAVDGNRLTFAYEGLDARLRRTEIVVDPMPAFLGGEAVYELDIAPQAAATLHFDVACSEVPPTASRAHLGSTMASADPLHYEHVVDEAIGALRSARQADPQLTTSNRQFDGWWNRSLADLHMLQTVTSEGPYPYAGVPWFSTPFGRDGILTALASLWLMPNVARGVLGYLAATQADEDDPERDAQPGKILHETRGGEMAALGEVPFARYYGSVDATPLFVMLAGAYLERTGDVAFAQRLWPHVEKALRWIDEYGDLDGDGFVEYSRRSARGLVHQGWKDSQDSVFHDDGRLAEGPIALCEVQAYVYGARLAAARLAAALGFAERAPGLEAQANRLRERFEDVFWCEDLSIYALALDGEKRPCKVRSSNAGHCLLTGIAAPSRALRVAETLLSEPCYSGWGIRTIASVEAGYNPMSYHNGSVWPHDNAIIAAGFGRYGLRRQASRVLEGLLDASNYFELHRLPELFCGFARRSGESATRYPTACSPQAWAAAAPLPCLEACLGIEIDGAAGRVAFRNPVLPGALERIRISNLAVDGGDVDIVITRHDHDVNVTLTRRNGEIEVLALL